MSQEKQLEQNYNYTVVRQFTLVTILWGIVGMGVGVLIAAQLVWPQLNFDTPWLTYSRLRPCILMRLFLRSVQVRCLQHHIMEAYGVPVRRVSLVALLVAFTFWGWQAIIPVRCNYFTVRFNLW